MRKKIVILQVLMIIGCLFPASVFARWPSSLFYEQTVTSQTQGSVTSKIWIKGKKLRMEQTIEKQKVITLIRGESAYLYYPALGIALKTEANVEIDQERKYPKRILEYLKNMEAVLLGQEQIGGKLCDVYWVVDPQKGARGRIWIWKEKNFPLKSVMTIAGETITAQYKNIQMNIDIPDTYFELPPEVQIVDMSQLVPVSPEEKEAPKIEPQGSTPAGREKRNIR